MKHKRVFILSGPPAAGKSTWIRNHLTPTSEWISRDKIRFSIVKEDEEYFSHEDEVFDTFIAYINQMLADDEVEDIYVDATHINKKSRHKTLSRLHQFKIDELNCVCFDVREEVCQSRNELRPGRERVPATAITNMFKGYFYPKSDEKFDNIYIVDENGETRRLE